MKKFLIISDEETPRSKGFIPGPERYGLPAGIHDIGNLTAVIQAAGAYETAVLHHSQIHRLRDMHPDCVVLSGRFSDKALPYEVMLKEYGEVISWIQTADVPMLGICMGLQLICAAFGVGTKPLCAAGGEYGFTEISFKGSHRIKEGLPPNMNFMELHRCGAERLPEGFALLADSELCPIQMIAHEKRPIVGTQFHPELFTPAYPDGKLLLGRLLHILSAE